MTTRVSERDLETCISCGLCLNDCPTFRLTGDEADSPRGRIHLIRAMVATSAPPPSGAAAHLDSCVVCRACETACPSGVPFGRIMEDARAVLRERRGAPGPLERLGLALIVRRRALVLAALALTVYARSGLRGLVRRLLPASLAARERLVAAREGPPARLGARGDGTVGLFAGCVMHAAFGDTQRATARLLAEAGEVVSAPEGQVCCGALHVHTGDAAGARDLARRNLDAFGGGAAPIVVNAAGCGAQLKEYGALLADEPGLAARAAAFAARVRDLSEVLPLRERRGPRAPLRVVYQDACHLAHGQGIRKEPRRLLLGVAGVELVPIADAERCCGSGGAYNLLQPELAGELGGAKAAAILAARPDVVVSGNPGCILQVRAALRAAGSTVPVVHLARFLADPADFGHPAARGGADGRGVGKWSDT